MKKHIKTDIIAIAIILVAIALLFALGYRVGSDKTHKADYENYKQLIVYTVKDGDTLSGIAQRYCPDHIYVLEYQYEIAEMNNIDGDIYVGDEILLYTDMIPQQYILQGYYKDGLLYTVDGNEWEYHNSYIDNGDVAILFNDNGTSDNVIDDKVIKVWED